MELLSAESARAYRGLVYEESDFYAFFRQVTPVDVVERMQIGSRPPSELESQGIAAMRSTTWSHAWSQCRYMLPGWFGAGTALAAAEERLGLDVLRQMASEWFFFSSLIDEIELALARADLGVAAAYDELVEPSLRRFIPRLREEYELTKRQVLRLRGAETLLEREPTIRRSILLRNPYIDPMHLVQVDLLKRWRAGQRADRELLSALLASVSGIGQALQGS